MMENVQMLGGGNVLLEEEFCNQLVLSMHQALLLMWAGEYLASV